MKAKIVISDKIWREAITFIFSDKKLHEERAGFLICGVSRDKSRVILASREFVPINTSDLIFGMNFGIQIRPKKIIDLINRSYPRSYCLLEIHSHPWKGRAAFSILDKAGVQEIVSYLFPQFPQMPYGAMIMTKNSFVAEVWFGKKTVETEVKVLCRNMPVNTISKREQDKYDRQIKFFGEDVQKKLQYLNVGIVGLGGTGSHVAQQLAYLGVKKFVLVDHDSVEASNINRLIGASEKDIGRKKTEVIEGHIRFINPKAETITISKPVYAKESILELKNTDFIFGCTDNDAARVVLNNISSAYLIPYIDVGSDINIFPNGSIESVGGRTFNVFPDGPCLLCAEGEINKDEVLNELSSDEELHEKVSRGYAKGRIARPSIISVNGIIASQAVTEFIFFIMRVKRPIKFLYDIYGMLVKFFEVRKNKGCIHCIGNFGIADAANIEHYGKNKNSF